VDAAGDPLAGDQAAYLSIDADGFVAVAEASYPGGSATAQLKAITAFGEAVFKEIVITESCAT